MPADAGRDIAVTAEPARHAAIAIRFKLVIAFPPKAFTQPRGGGYISRKRQTPIWFARTPSNRQQRDDPPLNWKAGEMRVQVPARKPERQLAHALYLRYCASPTFSIQSTVFPFSASWIAICVIAVVGVAP